MTARIVPFEFNHLAECERILTSLPDWFGIPESNEDYLRNLATLPSWVALRNESVVGAITLETHLPRSREVYFMAVAPSDHRQGVGSALLDHLESEARSHGGGWLHVKTLGPSNPDPYYARTRAFYLAKGFEPLFESPTIWGPENPTLVLLKQV